MDRQASVDNLGTPGVPNIVLSYGYDAVGNTTSVADNLGVSVGSSYDARDLLISRTWQGGDIDPARIDFGYNARWDRISIDRFADVAGTQQIGRSAIDYDAKGRLTDATNFDALDAALSDYDYAYDLADQITQQTYNGDTSGYTYDDSSQLTDAVFSAQADEDYAYDANGNRMDGTVVGPNNQLLSDGTFDYAYDNEGNLTLKTEIATGEVTEYTYDHRNRMTRVEQQSSGGIILSEADYTYDIFDRRIAKTVDADGDGAGTAETTRFVYDGDHVWADFDSSGNITARYLFGDRIDEILARWQPGNGTAWYLTDRLGTVRDIVDASGVLINTITYDSFGNVLSQTNAAAGDRYLFTGREFDAETGLYYYRARYYDPATGRFVSQDPIGFDAGDANLYRYVGNAPTNATDPTGLFPVASGSTINSRISLPLLLSPLQTAAINIGSTFAARRGIVVTAVATGQLVAAQVSAIFSSLAVAIGSTGLDISSLTIVGDNFIAFAQNARDAITTFAQGLTPEQEAAAQEALGNAGRTAQNARRKAEELAERLSELGDEIEGLRDAIDDLDGDQLDDIIDQLEAAVRRQELVERAQEVAQRIRQEAEFRRDGLLDILFPPGR